MTRSNDPRPSIVEDQRGAQIVEYILILGIVSLLAMGGYRMFGRAVNDKVESQARAVEQLRGSPSTPGEIGATSGDGAPSSEDGNDDDDDGGGGGLWGTVKGIAGGAKDLAGDAVDLAGDALDEARDFKAGFERGLLQGAGLVATGIFNAVTHPVETFEGLAYASSHPFETLWAIGDTYADQIAADPAEGLGILAFDVAATVLTLGSTGVIAQGTKTAKVVDRVNDTDNTVAVIDGANTARDNEAPGFVTWADRNFAPWILPQIPRPRLP